MSGRQSTIKIRVSPEEREAIFARARGLGITVSDLLRQAALSNRIRVHAVDSAAAYELRRLGAMLKHLYPAESNWTKEEKRRYWQAMEAIFGFAEQLVGGKADAG